MFDVSDERNTNAIENPITAAHRAYAKEKIGEIRSTLHAVPKWTAQNPKPITHAPIPRQPTFAERVAAYSAPDPASAWAIPDDDIEARAAEWEASQGHVVDAADDYEPDAWRTRKDMQ